MEEARFMVGKFNSHLYVRLSGDITMQNVLPLSLFFKTTDFSSLKSATIDFSNVKYLDSTALGILTYAAMESKKNDNRLILANLSPKLKEEFSDMSIEEITDVTDANLLIDEKALSVLPKSSEEMSGEDILEAHKNLSSLSEKNRQMFKMAIELIEKELDEIKELIDESEGLDERGDG